MDAELVDRYILGEMDDQERRTFEKDLISDIKLRREVALHQNVIDALTEFQLYRIQAEIKAIDEELHQSGFFSDKEEKDILMGLRDLGEDAVKQEIESIDHALELEGFFEEPLIRPERKIYSIRRIWMAAAAAVSLLLLSVWWLWSGQVDPDQLYAIYFEIPKETITAEILIEKSEVGFISSANEGLTDLEESIELYNHQNYHLFLAQTEGLLRNPALSDYKDRLHFLRAISNMILDQFNQAAVEFSGISKPTTEILITRSLNDIKLGNTKRARSTLRELDSSRAKSILNDFN